MFITLLSNGSLCARVVGAVCYVHASNGVVLKTHCDACGGGSQRSSPPRSCRVPWWRVQYMYNAGR
jgi:hypothetical protein